MKKSIFLTIILCLIVSLFSVSFAVKVPSDVKGTKQKTAVRELMELEIVDGYPDGTYRPDAVVSRSELAKLLVVSYGLDGVAKTYTGKTQYTDVNEVGNHWASGYINVSTNYQFINGYPDGTFKPDNTVTYAEAITMCLRALGYTKEIESNGTWPINYISKAQDLKLVKDITINSYDDGAKRGDIAILVWNMLNTEMEGISGNKTMLEVKFPDYIDEEESGDTEDNKNVEVKVNLAKESVTIPLATADGEFPYKIDYTVTPSDAKVKLEIKDRTLDGGYIIKTPLNDYIDEDGRLVCALPSKQPRTIKVAIKLDSDGYKQSKGTELAVFTLKIVADENSEVDDTKPEVKVKLAKESVTIPLSAVGREIPYQIDYTVTPKEAKVKFEMTERNTEGPVNFEDVDDNGRISISYASAGTLKVSIILDSDGYKQSKGTVLATFTMILSKEDYKPAVGKTITIPTSDKTFAELGRSDLGNYKVSQFHDGVEITADDKTSTNLKSAKVTGKLKYVKGFSEYGSPKNGYYLIVQFDETPAKVNFYERDYECVNNTVVICIHEGKIEKNSLGGSAQAQVFDGTPQADPNNIYIRYSDDTEMILNISKLTLVPVA